MRKKDIWEVFEKNKHLYDLIKSYQKILRKMLKEKIRST